jgi:hypothetical protein
MIAPWLALLRKESAAELRLHAEHAEKIWSYSGAHDPLRATLNTQVE